MAGRHISLAIALAAACVAGCSDKGEKAAAFATLASNALQSGNLPAAQVQISRALALRDDVSDYWVLKAQIALAGQDLSGAFDAYQNVITLDRSNVEALTRLCQLALSGNIASRAVPYADQLSQLRPGDPLPDIVRASAALASGDKKETRRLLDGVLATDKQNPQALIVESQLAVANEDFAAAAAAIERSLAAPGEPTSRLMLAKAMYRRGGDLAGYARSVMRVAQANPQNAALQLEYAASLYDSGDAVGGLAVAKQVLDQHPDDVATAATVLALWLEQGRAAMPPSAISSAADASLETRAAYAQYANEIGRPDLALTLLESDAPFGPVTAATADAKAADAYALALTGKPGAARPLLDAVLAADPAQPRALLARGRLRGMAGDIEGALQDVRRVVADDGDNATARLVLCELLLKQGQPALAELALRDGLRNEGADPRLALRLAALLRAQGKAAEAADALTDYARANPMSRRAARLAG